MTAPSSETTPAFDAHGDAEATICEMAVVAVATALNAVMAAAADLRALGLLDEPDLPGPRGELVNAARIAGLLGIELGEVYLGEVYPGETNPGESRPDPAGGDAAPFLDPLLMLSRQESPDRWAALMLLRAAANLERLMPEARGE